MQFVVSFFWIIHFFLLHEQLLSIAAPRLSSASLDPTGVPLLGTPPHLDSNGIEINTAQSNTMVLSGRYSPCLCLHRLLFLLLLSCWTTPGECTTINPMGNLRKTSHVPEFDELPGTEGYDVSTGFISRPDKECTQLQVDYENHCENEDERQEGDKTKTQKQMTVECDARRNKWMGKCVFGDGPVGGR